MARRMTTYYSFYPLHELEDVSDSVHGFVIPFFRKHRFLLKARGVSQSRFIREMSSKYNFKTTRQYLLMLEKGDRSCSVFFLAYIAHYHGMNLEQFCSDLFTRSWVAS